MVNMSEIKLEHETLTLNLNAVSIKEFRSLFDASQPDDNEFAVIGKAIGKTAEQVSELGQVDYRRVLEALLKAAREPLADPT